MTLTTLLSNVTEVTTAMTTFLGEVLDVFMEPPLVLFIGIGIFGVGVRIASRLIKSR